MARRNLVGKRIILTGASSGLGKAIALALNHYNPRLVLNARRESQLVSLATELRKTGTECEYVVGDVTNPETQSKIVEKCVDVYEGIDLLINNAGIGAMGPFKDAKPDRLRKVFEINFFSMAELTRISLPHLSVGDDAMIVNIGSVLGHRAVPLKLEYCASKFAVHGFSDALRAELADASIDVLHVCPSTIDTEFFNAAVEDTTGKNWKSNSAMKPNYVADKIVQSIIRRKHELIIPWSAKFLTWFDRLLPSLANRIIARFGQ